jgi:hypothetical protein
VGKAEGQGCSKEGWTSPEESLCSQADEPCYEEETVSDDESKVGGEEEGCVGKTATSVQFCCRVQTSGLIPKVIRDLRISCVPEFGEKDVNWLWTFLGHTQRPLLDSVT